MPKQNEKILPDRKALKNVEREYPTAPPAEKYRLAQADTLILVNPRWNCPLPS
jgi:putative NADPH-quinone reductase